MANEEHLAILKQGVEVWNRWRLEHVTVRPGLSQINLQGVNLRGFNLRGANLYRADLQEVNFEWANLSGADMEEANCQEANLQEATFFGANLIGANLTKAKVGFTVFGDLFLLEVQGLDTVSHYAPSTIGIDTLYNSLGQIPDVFLRGCGVPENMIEYYRSLVIRPIDYYSVFISYSHADAALAERLHADLQARGVRCWYAPHDLQIGEPILSGIDRGIRLHDKLLLILSASAVESTWIEQEVEMALARERTERRRVLFPIRIDDAVSAHTAGWPALVWSQRHVGDFREWHDYATYQAAFSRLLRDLKAEKGG